MKQEKNFFVVKGARGSLGSTPSMPTAAENALVKRNGYDIVTVNRELMLSCQYNK